LRRSHTEGPQLKQKVNTIVAHASRSPKTKELILEMNA
jgi:hypothetical protein